MRIKVNYTSNSECYEMIKLKNLVTFKNNGLYTEHGPIIINLGGRSIPF